MVVSAQDVGVIRLRVSPFVPCHHQGVLAVGDYLVHGFAIGICHGRFALVAVVVLGYKSTPDGDTNLGNRLIVHQLHMGSLTT